MLDQELRIVISRAVGFRIFSTKLRNADNLARLLIILIIFLAHLQRKGATLIVLLAIVFHKEISKKFQLNKADWPPLSGPR